MIVNGKDLEGGGDGIIEPLSWYLPEGTEETHEKYYSLCPGRYSDRAPSSMVLWYTCSQNSSRY
jgi:hypothetical protein